MIELGDCRDIMRRWIAQGVRAQMCVTSPPYWGLRDYGTAQWEGGSAECDHIERPVRKDITPERLAKRAELYGSGTDQGSLVNGRQWRDVCPCGARRIDRQLGLESTPEEYVANMVEVFRLVRDVLAEDGTLWLNLGDSYAANGTPGASNLAALGERYRGGGHKHDDIQKRTKEVPLGLKPKDLVGIPWRLAFALQADGWYLRSDIIWAKPNPMPESVTDRPTKAHEYLFLLSKRERYFYDAEAIREDGPSYTRKAGGYYGRDGNNASRFGGKGGFGDSDVTTVGRNRRTVWEIATQPYAEAHFATFPEALVEPCILAGSRSGDVVLDPFMGSGTVARVATSLGRRYLGCELNPEYTALADVRSKVTMGLSL